MAGDPVLEVRNLKKYFKEGNSSVLDIVRSRKRENIHAVDGVDFSLHANESIGIIGESGCGKTTLLMTLAGLHEPTDGDILFRGRSLSTFSRRDWKEYRRNVQMVFQDPYNSLDPKFTVRETIKEPLDIHDFDDKDERIHRVLRRVELQPPEKFLDQRPTQLSGGERQRVSIARALVIEPSVILADEPVSMLDVSTQASLLKLMSRLVNELDVLLIYISHDLSTVSYICQQVNVMYLGRIVETSPVEQLIDDPKHPYSQALINAVPIPDPHYSRRRTELTGAPSDPIGLGEGCRFRHRCPERMDVCDITPLFVDVGDGNGDRKAACHLYYDHEQTPTIEGVD